MSRRQRLRGRARIAAVRTRGAEGRNSGVRVRALANGEPLSRAGFAVTGRTTAVRRNRVRRRLRAAVTGILERHPGVDVLVYARPGPPEQPFPQLVDAIARALTQATAKGTR